MLSSRIGAWLGVAIGLCAVSVAAQGVAEESAPPQIEQQKASAAQAFEAAFDVPLEAAKPEPPPPADGESDAQPAPVDAGKGDDERFETLEAVAVLHDSKGSAIAGRVEFQPAGDALTVRAELGGLVPGAMYRLQIHEYGDCSALRARSAGAVFGDAERLVAFRAGDDGWVDLAFSHRGHILDRSAASVLGRSLVVHGTTEREGCGTIGLAKRNLPQPEPVPAKID